jgi:hypothetical protein
VPLRTNSTVVRLGLTVLAPTGSNPEKRIWPPYENILTPEEQLLDVEAWRLAQEHVEQAKYASWQWEAERREAQQAKERAKAGTG